MSDYKKRFEELEKKTKFFESKSRNNEVEIKKLKNKIRELEKVISDNNIIINNNNINNNENNNSNSFRFNNEQNNNNNNNNIHNNNNNNEELNYNDE